jgi:dihydrofolate reductase
MSRKIILYIAMSLDGYIASNDDNLDFLNIVDSQDEDFGYVDFTRNVDTIIWGRKTYDKILSYGIPFPHKDKKVYVLSHTRMGNDANVTYSHNLIELVTRLKREQGKDIYCDGGAELVTSLLEHSFIDQIVISVIPHLLGNGKRLFKDGRPEEHLKFRKSLSFPSGLVQLWYDRIDANL